MVRTLRIAFPEPEDFEREYNANLANAGVFVATEERFELRERVEVELSLGFAPRSVRLDGEVVHIVSAEMATAGGTRGVALQLSLPAHEVREQLAPLVEASGSFQRDPRDTGVRSAPRVPARVAAILETPDGLFDGHTRNLSLTGVLVELDDCDLTVGAVAPLSLVHPVTGRAMEVPARVARQVRNGDRAVGLGLAFQPPAEQEDEFRRFIEGIQSAEHSRLLGGVSGSLAEIGPQNLLQMFASSAQVGTLRLIRGQLEGLVGFERGLLRYARLGSSSGMKALTRLLAWDQGGFEFHSGLEPVETPEPPLPLEAAVFEAVRQIDELSRVENFPPQARLQVVAAELWSQGDPSKVEEAIVDLARAGFQVERIVDVIPEPDAEIYRAIASLVDLGVVRCAE